MNEVNIIDDMIKTIVDYITRKRNNEWLKMIKMNEIKQETKYINYKIIALSARMTHNIRKALMTLSDLWTDNQREHKFNNSVTIQQLWALWINLSHFTILPMMNFSYATQYHFLTVDVLSIIEQAFIDRRQLRGRIIFESAFCNIFAPVNITQSNQHRL